MPKGILITHPLNIESNSFHSTLLRTVEMVILLKKGYLIVKYSHKQNEWPSALFAHLPK